MNSPCCRWMYWTLIAGLAVAVGCSSSEQPSASERPSGDEADASMSEETAETIPFRLGDMLEPFKPPPLEELDRTAGWVDRPVVDVMELMRERQADQGPPPLSVLGALALRNESPENNEKIRATLGRLAPPDGAGVDFDSVMVRKANSDLKTANPLLGSTMTDQDFESLTGLALFTFDQDFNYFADADVVVSWQTSQDGLMDKIVMRDDLTWSDGKPVTSHDFVFTFQAIMTDAVIVPALRHGKDQIRWLEAYDDHTLVFFHKEALATNIGNMLFGCLPKHIYEDTIPEDPSLSRSERHSYLEDHPVVAGAYELTKRVRGQEFVLKRREAYYMHDGKQVRRKPYFKEVRFRVIEDFNTALLALKGGDLSETELTAEQWVSQTTGDDFYERNTKVTAPEWTTYYIGWNLQTPYFSDRRVRQAMSYALDYHELINAIFYGLYQPNRGTFHPTSWMFPENGPEPYQQDLDKAEQLLDAAGWTDSDGDGIRDKEINGRRIPFRFTMLTTTSPVSIATGTLMRNCLEQIGVECLPKPTEFTVLVQMSRDKKFQAFMGAWGTGAEPDTMANIFGTGQMRNYGSYSNPRVDELFVAARRELDQDKRAKLYGEIHNILWEDQPYTWLVYRDSFYGFSKRLRGYNFSPRGPYNFGPGFSSIYMPAVQP